MKEILSQLDRWQEQGGAIALATLVRVERSAPRAAGARLAVAHDGRMAGSVSAGCVEGDVVARALEVIESGQPVLAHYGISDEQGIAVGLSCGGAIDVWIERFAPGEAWAALREAVAAERPLVFATALAPEPLAGRALALGEAGERRGGIAPAVDAALAERAEALLAEGAARLLEIETPSGPARVFAEAIAAPPRLFIVGATHTATALARLAASLDFRVTVIDPRSPFATPERFPDAVLRRDWPDAVLAAAALDAGSYVVTLTHDPKFDVPALACALRSPARYVGALGSRATQRRRREQLGALGFAESELARIHGPVGLDLGARTPGEIALAIAAEMVAVRRGREGGARRERRAPIHGR